MRTIVPLALLAGLAACAAQQQAEKVRDWTRGQSLDALESCLGVPDHTDAREGRNWAEWSYSAPASSASIPFSDVALLPLTWPASLVSSGSASFSSAGSCRAVATLLAGKVVSFRYGGDKAGLAGPDALCAPIVSGCDRD
jgi:hypothetical protein